MCDKKTDTDGWLAAHYPNLDRELLRGLNEEIGTMKEKNGGNANIFLMLRNGFAEWIESTQRIVLRRPMKK